MPNHTTLRDVVPILEDLRQLTKVPLVAKQDTILYKRIAEATSKLCSIDIEKRYHRISRLWRNRKGTS